ncbi:hypothetical protein, partial [Micromonospora sp. CPCC 205556]|uniref:hypothetical protein n=1 Tax=Micromonospora sp. CPCC 205556 TaxID=3122398 RepID=UPI003B603DA3
MDPLVEEDCMGTPSADVEQYLTDLQHPLKAGVLELKAAILASDLAITEHVKWNTHGCRGAPVELGLLLRPSRVMVFPASAGGNTDQGPAGTLPRGSLPTAAAQTLRPGDLAPDREPVEGDQRGD